MRPKFTRIQIIQAFIRRTCFNGGCVEWTGKLSRLGYGRTFFNGKERMAHRVSWELANGCEPVGKVIMHACDNPKCVNPEHLICGTQGDNMRDMHSKGRHRCAPTLTGTRRWRLTKNDCERIADLRRDFKAAELAQKYNVSAKHIHNIWAGWRPIVGK